jgi:hypothetical protein
MSVDRSVRAVNSSRSSGVGSFGNSYVQNQADDDQFNIKTRAAMGDPDAIAQLDPNDPSNISPETIKAVHAAALREDRAAQDRVETKKNADAFIAAHPELIDNTANAQLLLNQARTMFGDKEITVDNWERAYEYLRTNTNFLKLDAKEVENKRQAAAKQRYATEKARVAERTFNPNANYDELSLEEIRNRADEETRKQFELEAQRGGSGW